MSSALLFTVVLAASPTIDLASAAGCEAHCLIVEPVEDTVRYYYADGGGRTHLLSTTARAEVRQVPGDISGRSIMPSSSHYSGCGSDGWGWRFGDVLAQATLPDGGTFTVRYLGRAAALAEVRNAAGAVGTPLRVVAGEAPGLDPSCREARHVRDGGRVQ